MTLTLEKQEQCVLCAALNEVSAWRTVTAQLQPRDFSSPDHQAMFAAISSVVPEGRGIDVVMMGQALRASNRADLLDYLGETIDTSPTFEPLPTWITAVLEASISRRMAHAMTRAADAIASGTSRLEAEHTLEQTLAAIRASAPDGRVFDDKRLMAASAIAYLDDDARAGTPFGFAPWDAAVLPVQPSNLVLIGGASGSGKSTIARNVLRNMVQRYSRNVGWLTCEMSGEEQLVHLACIDSQVDLEEYYRRRLRDHQRNRFAAELNAWTETPLLKINEMGSTTPAQALSIFRRWREQGVTHFVLDHLHRLDYGAVKSGDDLRIPVAAFAKALKNFAKDSEACVYALVQYSKIKPHEEPSDDKIRESNTILEEADAVFHIYRPNVACHMDHTGHLIPLVKGIGGRYFEHDAPKDSTLAPDREAVYVKLGKQRRRLRDGLIRIPFNHRLALMYDTQREDSAPLRIA
jgi:replicative DNA helicase